MKRAWLWTLQVLHNVRKGGIAFAFGALTGSKAHVNIMDLMASKKLEVNEQHPKQAIIGIPVASLDSFTCRGNVDAIRVPVQWRVDIRTN